MKSVLILAASLFISVSLFASADNNDEKKVKDSKSVTVVENVNVLQLTGSVVDNKNKETLAGATVYVDGKKYYSDLDGNFSVPDLKPGKHQVKVELISYEPTVLEVNVEKNQRVNISLFQK